MNVIPNVYEAAYMQGLVNSRKKEKSLFTVKEPKIPIREVRRRTKEAYDLGMSSSRPYTVEVNKNSNMFQGNIYAVQNQTQVAEVLKDKIGLKQFPTNTVVSTNQKFNKRPVDVNQQNVSGFLRYIEGYESEPLMIGKDEIIINNRPINNNTVTIKKSSLFNFK